MTDPKQVVLNALGYERFWDWQEEAIDKILSSDKNFLIKAPTGSGKTAVAYTVIAKYVLDSERIVYGVPSHALVNEKVKELERIFDRDIVKKIGGKDTLKGRILVGTYEQIFTLLRHNTFLLRDVGLAVLDDFHVLYDPHRGPKLEKLITFLLHEGTRIIALSATIKPLEDLAEWLSAEVIVYDKRPIPLKYQFVVASSRKDFLNLLYTNRSKYAPAIVFCKSRKETRKLALEYLENVRTAKHQPSLAQWGLGKRYTRKKQVFADDILEEFTARGYEITDDLVELAMAIEEGVAWHHRDLKPYLKEYVEKLFADGYLEYVFATTTLAHGVNTPSRSVIIYPPTRFCPECKGNKHPYIPVYEWLQMAGRAGRVGHSKGSEAYVVTVVSSQKAKTEAEKRFNEKNIGDAESHLENELPRFLMELIDMGYSSESQLLDVIMKSYWVAKSYKNAREAFRLLPLRGEEIQEYLWKTLQKPLSSLIANEWIMRDLGSGRYKLTKSGNVILDFMDRVYVPLDLETIRSIEQYIERLSKTVQSPVSAHGIALKIIDIVGPLVQIYPPKDDSTVPQEKIERLRQLIENTTNINLEEININTAYTWYILEERWVKGISLKEINDEFGAWATYIEVVRMPIADILQYLVAPLCEVYGIPTSQDFFEEIREIREGMPKELLVLSDNLPGIGRTLLVRLRSHLERWVRTLPTETEQGVQVQENIQLKALFNSSFLEFLIAAYQVYSKGFEEIVLRVPGWGSKRTKSLLEFLQKYSELDERKDSNIMNE